MKTRIYPVLFICLMTLSLSYSSVAQTWTQFVPVNTTLTQVGGFTGGCYPNPDFRFAFPGSPVTGVDYFFVVSQTPANSVLMAPYNDTLAVGDTLLVQPGTQTYSIYAFTGGGQVVFDIIAQGIPLVANQPYPCSVSPFWMSNLQLCPETLTNNVVNGCNVLAATGIEEAEAGSYEIGFPVTANNYQLSVVGRFTSLMVIDVTGKIIAEEKNKSEANLDLSAVSPGIYSVIMTNGSQKTVRKFSLR
jgi:hypothetical protein